MKLCLRRLAVSSSISELGRKFQKGAIKVRLPRQAEPVDRGLEQGALPGALAARSIPIPNAGSPPSGGIYPSGVEQCYNQHGLGRQLCLLAFEGG